MVFNRISMFLDFEEILDLIDHPTVLRGILTQDRMPNSSEPKT
jgi:hypothetical protein